MNNSQGSLLFLLLFTQLCPTLCDTMDGSTSGLPVLHYFPEFAKLRSIDWMMPSIHLILCHPLLLLPSIFPSNRLFSNESALCMRWPNFWSFSFNISLCNEHSGWFPLGFTGLISLLSKRLSRVFSNITVQKHQFFGTGNPLQYSCLENPMDGGAW